MIEHYLHSFGNPALLLTSKVILCATAFLLLSGRSALAAILAPWAVFFLQGTTKVTTTKSLEKWIILSFISSLTCLASWVTLALANNIVENNEDTTSITSIDDTIQAYKLWIVGFALQKGGAGALLYFLYRDSKAPHAEPENVVRFLEVRVWIKAGRNLVAKDTNIFGRPTTSDPYVKVFHGPNKLGKTAIIKKTLDPIWGDNESFQIPVIPQVLDVHRHIECNMYDHDNLSSDDPMGTVYIPIPKTKNEKVSGWYRLEKGEGPNFCKDAKGEIFVEVEVRAQLNKTFKRQLYKSASQRSITLDGQESATLSASLRSSRNSSSNKSSTKQSTRRFKL